MIEQGEKQVVKPILKAERIIKSFGGLMAVNNVSLTMDQRRVYGLVGPNGAGKTTLFNILTGFLKPDAGDIYYKSEQITKKPPNKVAQMGIARTFQNVRIFPSLTVLENIMVAHRLQVGDTALGAIFKRWGPSEKVNQEKAMALLETVGLERRANDITDDLAYPEQKILILARTVATGAELLLVDEPTSGLDQKSFKSVLAMLKKMVEHHGKTVCVVEHNMDLIREICDWVYFLHHGVLIAAGTCSELLQRKDLTDIYFGTGK